MPLIDHKDRDPMNNRRCNLRICTRRLNSANVGPRGSNKYKGVKHDKRNNLKKPFVSSVCLRAENGSGPRKYEYLGHFATPEEAARAYDIAAKRLLGEFAYLNFPEEP
jgi:hypothetical protein